MKRIRIYPYKLYSEGARALSTALDTICVKPDGRYRPRVNDLIINWGNSTIPIWYQQTDIEQTLNHPLNVAQAVNKLTTLQLLQRSGVPTPEWTTDMYEAQGWLNENNLVVERHNLTGSKGNGIIVKIPERSIAFQSAEVDDAPLYTKLIPRAREYRVHVFDGQVIDLQQKKRRVTGLENANDSDGTIKNLDNGWVFVRDDITPPPRSIFDVSIRAVHALGLDFGGVDVLVKDGECYVLEINCAVGLEGSTINSYVNAIKRYATR
jgi:glutathione synthase/RimK-type ligase-like ATP-grasp enzyme